MSARYVFDTSVLVEVLRGKRYAYEQLERLGAWAPEAQVWVSVVTVGELQAHVRIEGWGASRIARLHRLLAQLTVAPIDQTVLYFYGEADHFSRNYGRIARGEGGHQRDLSRKNDLWIAGTAMARDATLVTLDRGDMAHFRDYRMYDGHLLNVEVIAQTVAPPAPPERVQQRIKEIEGALASKGVVTDADGLTAISEPLSLADLLAISGQVDRLLRDRRTLARRAAPGPGEG